MKKYLLIALSLGFAFIAFTAFQQAKPTAKNAPIYQAIKNYSPYYIDKRFGGLQILSKSDEAFKEKPNNMEVFHRLDTLEKNWGKEHMKVINNELLIFNKSGAQIAKLPIETQEDSNFVHNFYGI
ncbi:hypothetical protein KKC13_02080 [bacterium]|nr:hypothetical protein [bacterium]MBU1957664.1 hypothetical protein [bacterium]